MASDLLWGPDEPSPYGNDDSYLPDDIDGFTDICLDCEYVLDDHGFCDFCDG